MVMRNLCPDEGSPGEGSLGREICGELEQALRREWLVTNGIGGYWESSVVTVGSDGAVTIRAVLPGTLQPDLWEAKGSWYDPGSHQATFLVTDSEAGFFHHWQPAAAALAALGRPARSYRTGPYTVYVWDKNLLVPPSQPAR